MNELTVIPPVDLVAIWGSQLRRGVVLDRGGARKLLRQLENLGHGVPPGCKTMIYLLTMMLERKDWKRIGIEAISHEVLCSVGPSIGIVEYTNGPAQRETPLQKMQRQNNVRRAR